MLTVDRKVSVNDLVGTVEIAQRLGLAHTESAMNLFRRHDDFPEPIAVLGERTRVWAWPDVEAWARATGRLSS